MVKTPLGLKPQTMASFRDISNIVADVSQAKITANDILGFGAKIFDGCLGTYTEIPIPLPILKTRRWLRRF